MPNKSEFYEKQAEGVIKKLEQRNMEAFYAKTSEEAQKKALELIEENSIVSFGGSSTLKEIGLIDAVKNGSYTVYDKSDAKTLEEKRELSLKAFDTDYYLMSSNAITLEGEIINIDAFGNRVAALIFGPKNVIIIAGMNKVIKDQDTAIKRIRNLAAPINTIRLKASTPCSKLGRCQDCISPETICCQTVITRYSKVAKRIKVILVGEELGY